MMSHRFYETPLLHRSLTLKVIPDCICMKADQRSDLSFLRDEPCCVVGQYSLAQLLLVTDVMQSNKTITDFAVIVRPHIQSGSMFLSVTALSNDEMRGEKLWPRGSQL